MQKKNRVADRFPSGCGLWWWSLSCCVFLQWSNCTGKGSSDGITHTSFVQQVEGASDPCLPQFPRIVNTPRTQNLNWVPVLQLERCHQCPAGRLPDTWVPPAAAWQGLRVSVVAAQAKENWVAFLFKQVQCDWCVWPNSCLYLIGWISKVGCIFSPLRQYTVFILLNQVQKENISSLHSPLKMCEWCMAEEMGDASCLVCAALTHTLVGFGWSWADQPGWARREDRESPVSSSRALTSLQSTLQCEHSSFPPALPWVWVDRLILLCPHTGYGAKEWE